MLLLFYKTNHYYLSSRIKATYAYYSYQHILICFKVRPYIKSRKSGRPNRLEILNIRMRKVLHVNGMGKNIKILNISSDKLHIGEHNPLDCAISSYDLWPGV